jgi:thioredoxin
MKHGPVKARFFEAFDFARLPEIQIQPRKPLFLSAFHFCCRRGTTSALSRLMREKNEKPKIEDGVVRVITTSDFVAEVLASKQPVLVAFSTSWSRACQVLDPVLQELAGAYGGKFKVLKVDADHCLDLSLCYEIQSVPTLIFFVGGKPCERIVGTASKEAILAKTEAQSR